jgi:hypothetical protein
VEVLGGYVEKLVENWKIQKEHEKKSSWGKAFLSAGDVGAPKWKSLDVKARGPAVHNVKNLRNAKVSRTPISYRCVV